MIEQALERARCIWREADKRKAGDLVVLDVSKLTIICDCFIVATGRSLTHIEALAEGVVDGCEEAGMRSARRTSPRDAKWVVVDYDDVVLHILTEEARRHYDLEELWSGAETIVFDDEDETAESSSEG